MPYISLAWLSYFTVKVAGATRDSPNRAWPPRLRARQDPRELQHPPRLAKAPVNRKGNRNFDLGQVDSPRAGALWGACFKRLQGFCGHQNCECTL